MGDVHYMISETAKRVGVESHVLRYWEEELALPIGRTEMGHRHYTEDDIQLFNCIKELKEQGMQLKELKGVIPDMLRAREQLRRKRRLSPLSTAGESSPLPKLREETGGTISGTFVSLKKTETTKRETAPAADRKMPDTADRQVPDASERKELDTAALEQKFLSLMKQALSENNPLLEELIRQSVTEKVAKDVDFLLQARDRQDEDRYRKLDHLIRQQQTLRKEAARPVPVRYIRRIFGEI